MQNFINQHRLDKYIKIKVGEKIQSCGFVLSTMIFEPLTLGEAN